MDQIIGKHKEFIVLERKELEKLEKSLRDTLKTIDIHTETYKQAYFGLDFVEWVKKNNIYTKDFVIKK